MWRALRFGGGASRGPKEGGAPEKKRAFSGLLGKGLRRRSGGPQPQNTDGTADLALNPEGDCGNPASMEAREARQPVLQAAVEAVETDMDVANSLMKKPSLPVWERAESDDQSSAEMDSQPEDSLGWSPFLAEEDTKVVDRTAVARLQLSKLQRGGSLQSYEEKTLGLRVVSQHEVARVQSEGRVPEHHDVDEQEYRKQLQETSRKNGFTTLELPMDGIDWVALPHTRAVWKVREGSGELSGSGDDMIAVFLQDEVCFGNFDIEAEFQISSGLHGGIAFHIDGSARPHYQVALLNFAQQKLQLIRKVNGRQFYEDLGDISVDKKHFTKWYFMRVRAVGHNITFWFNHEQVAMKHIGDVWGETAGHFGIWSMESTVRLRSMMVTSLTTYMDMVKEKENELRGEETRIKTELVENTVHRMRYAQATRLIQDVTRNKLSLIQQRMKQFRDAEHLHRDVKLRERKLLAWLSILVVLKRFDDAMHDEDIWEKKSRKYLEHLDRTSPPPPPPPREDPPESSAVSLHSNYEDMKRRHEHKWLAAGKKALGEHHFEQMRLSGFAEVLDEHEKRDIKGEIAHRYRQQALKAASEITHQEHLRSAACLESDWRMVSTMSSSSHMKHKLQHG